MKHTLILTLGAITIMSLMGCQDELNEEDSQRAWAATQSVLGQGSAGSSGTGGGPEGKADGLGGLDFTFPCEGNVGSARFNGQLNGSGGAIGFSYNVTFTGCASQGTTIDGDLNYKMTLSSGENAFGTSFTYNGVLTYSGEVDGSCTIDMRGESSASFADNTLSAGLTYSGSVCGHDASETLNTSFSF